VRNSRRVERAPRTSHVRVVSHAHDNDVVFRHGPLHFAHDVGMQRRHLVADGGVNARFVEDWPRHVRRSIRWPMRSG
jgi:hypothetical protein